MYRTAKAILILLFFCTVCTAQDVASFEKRITVKTLPNGLTVLVCERPEAPVFSFFTHVDAGSAQDLLHNEDVKRVFLGEIPESLKMLSMNDA